MRIRVLIASLFFISISLAGNSILAQPPLPLLKINASNTSGLMGSVACVDFSVENFINIQSLQFSIHFDPRVIQPICPPTQLYLLGLNSVNFNCNEANEGYIKMIWLDPNSGQACGETLADGSDIFTLCFDLVGDPGTVTPIYIAGDQLEIEYSQIPDCNDVNNFIAYVTADTMIGTVSIECGSLSLFTGKCDSAPAMNTGSLNFYTCGGSAPYSYNINAGAFTGIITNQRDQIDVADLAPGVYDIVISDNAGAMVSGSVTIGSAQTINVAEDITNPTCWNRTNGRITIPAGGITGGTAPYITQWDNFQFNNPEYTRLNNGTYGLTVTDTEGCKFTKDIDVFIDTIKVQAEILTNASCPGANDGVIRLLATGGSPYNGINYSFNGSTPISVYLDNQVEQGWFFYEATDSASPTCRSERDSIFIDALGDITTELTVTNITCFGAGDGTVILNASGGTDFRFNMVDESGNPPLTARSNRTTYECFVLTEGFWFITTEDRILGCTKIDTIEITEPPELIVAIDSLNPTCLGNDGSITILASGGIITAGYNYMWSDSGMTSDRINLPGGVYSVTVSDDNMCEEIRSINLSADGQILTTPTVVNEISCKDSLDGALTVIVDSPGAYSYRWISGTDTIGRSPNISNVGSGTYKIIVRDTIQDCFTLDSIILSTPASISIDVTYTLPQCPSPDFRNGSIGITPAGGSGNFTYTWDDASTNSVLGAIPSGNYNVTVTDSTGCSLDSLLFLDEPAKIDVQINSVIGVDCFGDNNGRASAIASGGTIDDGRYNFFWSSGAQDVDFDVSTSNASNLSSGTQYVIVVDAQCASDTIFFDVPSIDAIRLDPSRTQVIDPNCFNGCDGSITAVAIGGDSTSYIYQWTFDGSISPTLSGICAGKYFVQITDGNNCTNIDSLILTNPDSLAIDIDPSKTLDPSCNNAGMAQIGVIAQGGAPDYTFSWTNNVSTTNLATGLADGNYFITVTDGNRCTDVASYILSSSEPIQATIAPIETPKCFGGRTCVTVESVTGGSGTNYTFTINRGIRFPIDSCVELFAGPYNLTVFDSDGCSQEYNIEVNQPEELSVDAGPDIELGLGETTEPINLEISSVFDIMAINWTPLDSIDCVTADCQVVILKPEVNTTYKVTIIDENGCTDTDDVNVVVSKRRNVHVANIFSPNQDGFNDYFQLQIGPGIRSVESFVIFDRWGNSMFEQRNYMPEGSSSDGWDGTNRGERVVPGVYGYVAKVRFIDNGLITYKGSITVVR